MTRFKLFVIITFVSISSLETHAQDITQNSNFSDELDTMFGGLSLGTARVPTGYLLDKAFEVADIRDFDGTVLSTNNYVDVNTFRNILLTINSSKVNSFGSAIDANAIIDGLADTTSVQLAVAAYKYNYIVSNALADNLITYQGGVVYDSYVNGMLQNPFGVANVFAFTPNRTVITNSSVRYKFNFSHFYGNLQPVSYEFDAGDGSGYIPILLPYDNTVQYNEYGLKIIKMRVRFLDSSYLESHAQLYILPTPIAQNNLPTFPNIIQSFSGTYCNESVSAKVSVKYKTSSSIITKPLIYVEGFDDLFLGSISNISYALEAFDDTTGLYFNHVMYDLLSSSRGSLNFSDLYDSSNLPESIKSEYDIIYIDWENPLADIRANAYLLEDIITWVNGIKLNTTGKKNVVFGHSMGGLVARYALRDMEIRGIEHDTSFYISHDSPHLGANVPLGALFAIRDIYSLFYGDNYSGGILTTHLFDGILAPIIRVLESKAARQMLINYVGRNGIIDNSIHEEWQDELDFIGFPKGDKGAHIENLCIVNGGALSNTENAHMLLKIKIENYSSFIQRALLAMLTRINNIDAIFNVYRDSGANCLVANAYASYKKGFLWSTTYKIISLIPSTQHYSPASSPGYDVVNSSSIASSKTIELFSNVLDEIIFNLNGQIAFIPTASALSVNDYSRDYYEYCPSPKNETPFDSFIARKDAHNHMYDTSAQWAWIDSLVDMSISGPSGFVNNGDCFSLINGTDPSDYLTTSDSSIATVLNNGLLSITNPGVVSIQFKKTDPFGFEKRCYYKHKTILACGPPRDLILSYTNTSDNNYTVTAECSSSNSNALLDEMAWSEDIKYIWGIKEGTNSIAWCDTTSTRTIDIVANPGSIVHMKIRDKNGNESNPNDLCRTLNPYPVFIPLLHYSYEPNVIYTYSGANWCIYDTLEDPSTYSFDPESGITYFIPTNYLMAWPTSGSSDGPYPDRIIIDNQVIMRDCIITQSINNNTVPVYCFKLLNSTYVQSVIANINSYPNQTAVVSGAFYDGDIWVRNFAVTITKGVPII